MKNFSRFRRIFRGSFFREREKSSCKTGVFFICEDLFFEKMFTVGGSVSWRIRSDFSASYPPIFAKKCPFFDKKRPFLRYFLAIFSIFLF